MCGLRYQDLNLDCLDQNQMCYRYTIPQFGPEGPASTFLWEEVVTPVLRGDPVVEASCRCGDNPDK